jgi:hypothetical protein
MKSLSIALVAAGLTSCATLNESMTLGAGIGAVAGGLATYAAQATAPGGSTSADNVLLGAGIGLAVGLVTSYFTHREVEDRRAACMADQIDMQFGDLPPSPFVFPKKLPKKGGR